RKDYQVKIRGYRIELGEIQEMLAQHPTVKEAVVIDREDSSGNKYLCAYLVPAANLATDTNATETTETTTGNELVHDTLTAINVAEMRTYLSTRLPEYMLPSYFEPLAAIPLTPNGKTDRRALPEPQGKINTGLEYESPRNEVEDKLLTVWKDVLKVDGIGINDNFFAIGGDSMNLIQVSAQIAKAGLKMNISDLFLNPTISELSTYVGKLDEETHPQQVQEEHKTIEPAPDMEYYELSETQKEIYLRFKDGKNKIGREFMHTKHLQGPLDLEQVEEAFRQIL
ncbi:MAG: hypothetical protein GY765_14505, partial [bacterium]|nr:hypothetical protein [bacterium]